MFDCPEQNHTSPTRMSRNVTALPIVLATMSS